MPQVKTNSTRKYFTDLREFMPMPDLVEVQKKSYDWFFKEGLKELFDEVSPIKDFIGRELELYLVDYYLDEPKFDEVTAKSKNITHEAPLRVNIRLVNKRTNEVKEQEIYLGDFPLMTDRGTFVVNGVERVIVSQLIRSAGVFFSTQNIRGRNYYGSKIIPNRGAWLEIETDGNGIIYVKIDRKRKVPVTALLRAFGYSSDEEIIDLFKDVDNHPEVSFIKNTIEKDISHNEAEGLKEIYKRIRPGDLATVENARSLIYSMFFNFERYDFGKVGRYKINSRFSLDIPNNQETRVLRKEDLVLVIKEIIKLNLSQEEADDIDHLGNRRVRSVGELIQGRFRIGLARMERIIRDRMSTLDINSLTPNQLINARPVIGVIKEFFMSSQLSQFMDQVNPLAELEHKRRLSAMGPGGLSRERAGFEVRDVHRTHYGKICPIETPEGPNIGLVGHLASYARVNDFGFIETPYRKVLHNVDNSVKKLTGKIINESIKGIIKKGETITSVKAKEIVKTKKDTIDIKPIVTDEIIYLDAFEEEKYNTVSITTPINDDGYFVNDYAEIRVKGVPMYDKVDKIDFIDVATNQIISVATALIPFMEHDDGQRTLMGTNMQRQAVSVIKPQAPVIGTGIEEKAARDSGQVIISKTAGKVISIDSKHIKIKDSKNEINEYILNKFARSNASTSINQHVIVNKGDSIKKGQIIADGAATEQGELALGQNMLVAYMTWDGGNYEDAVLISERIVKNDNYTSINIEDYSIDIRDTKLGPESVTRDIPNISEEKLKDLDREGIIRVGATVASGDILVGKITPKGETELSAEEKLLRAIFGEKAKDVRDSSLYLKHGEHGKIIGVKILSSDNDDKLPAGVIKRVQITIASLKKIQVGDKIAGRHGNKGVISRVIPEADMPFLEDGTPIDIILNPLGIISRMNLGQLLETHLGLAANTLGYKVASPALDGVPEKIIREELKKADWPEDGKLQLFDGRTGDKFKHTTTVGIAYMIKLNHLVESKIHQRSIGPYSLVTQQPLGGKAQFGGQRLGEMEVWALEAYGAASTLQEMITIKSDDVVGRSKAYESIIKGELIERLNIPESFNVLTRELKGLGLAVELINSKKKKIKKEDSASKKEAKKDKE